MGGEKGGKIGRWTGREMNEQLCKKSKNNYKTALSISKNIQIIIQINNKS